MPARGAGAFQGLGAGAELWAPVLSGRRGAGTELRALSERGGRGARARGAGAWQAHITGPDGRAACDGGGGGKRGYEGNPGWISTTFVAHKEFFKSFC